jgi:hypothetical protein
MLVLTGHTQISMLEADRPDQTETPAIVPVKHWQFETGFIIELVAIIKKILYIFF